MNNSNKWALFVAVYPLRICLNTVPGILCIAMQILLAVAGILNKYMIWMVQVIISHRIPGGTATHGKRGTAQV